MKFQEHDLSRKGAMYFLVIILFAVVFCSASMAERGLPQNADEAMAELERIKQGGVPAGGMGQQDFMKMAEESYTDEDMDVFCANNLRKVRAAKEEYINDHLDQIDEIKEITEEMIEPYIRGGVSSLICKTGGKISIGDIETAPACSIHGGLDSK